MCVCLCVLRRGERETKRGDWNGTEGKNIGKGGGGLNGSITRRTQFFPS